MQGVMGLDYNPVLAILRLYAVEDATAVFEDLQVMEGRAIELINAAASKQAKEQQLKKQRRAR